MPRGKDTGSDPRRQVDRRNLKVTDSGLTKQQSRWFSDYEDDSLNPPIGKVGPAAKVTGRI